MAVTELERVKVRRYMGWPPGKTEPRYDSLIDRIQSTSDGGVMVDDSTELDLRAVLADIATIETRLRAQWDTMEAGKVDELGVDPVRAVVMLRSEGRRLVSYMASILDAQPLRNPFSPGFR